MSEYTGRGVSDHLTVELYERMARIAAANGRTGPGVARLIEAHLMTAMRDRWFERRGHVIPKEVKRGD